MPAWFEAFLKALDEAEKKELSAFFLDPDAADEVIAVLDPTPEVV